MPGPELALANGNSKPETRNSKLTNQTANRPRDPSPLTQPSSHSPKEPPMIVVMEQGATQSQINHVVQLIKELGLREHVIAGTERTVIAAIGDDRAKNKE